MILLYQLYPEHFVLVVLEIREHFIRYPRLLITTMLKQNCIQEIIEDIRVDYWRHSDNWDMLHIPQRSAGENFWSWFVHNAACYTPSTLPLTSINELTLHGGACYGNSLAVLRHMDAIYCEGFVQLTNTGWIPHGFNLQDQEVLDYTVANNQEVFSELGNHPTCYAGVVIPNSFIEVQNPEYYHQSLLWAFYIHSTLE
jgi:hypothetical protein